MTQLKLIHTQPRRPHIVPATCPFNHGDTVRHTRLGITAQVLQPLHDPLMPGSWWLRVHPHNGAPEVSWLASLCEAA